jgi:hypothetical protein
MGIGRTGTLIGFDLALSMLRGHLENRLIEIETESAMKKLGPTIQGMMNRQAVHALDLRAQGKEAWVNVTMTRVIETYGPKRSRLPHRSKPPKVTLELSSVEVTDKNGAGSALERVQEGDWVTHTSQSFTTSAEWVFDQELEDYYSWLKEELEWYNESSNAAFLPAELQMKIVQQKYELEQEFKEFLDDVANGDPVIPPHLTPDDLTDLIETPIDPQNILPIGWTLPPSQKPAAPKPKPATEPPKPEDGVPVDGTGPYEKDYPGVGMTEAFKPPWSARSQPHDIGPDNPR